MFENVKLKVKSRFVKDEDGSTGTAGAIVGMSIGAMMLAYVLWPAIQEVFNTTQGSVDSGVYTMGTKVIGTIIMVAVMVLFLKKVGIKIS